MRFRGPQALTDMDEFRVGGVFADYNLTKPEKEGRFEARVRCLEREEKLKKLNSA